MSQTRKPIVYVGMSGGVDSSVSAAILQSQGFVVKGVFIKVWQPDIVLTAGTAHPPDAGRCTWREDRLDAMRVCAKLGIPFFTLDLEKEYRRDVVDYMFSEYQAGRTPNPDVMCNKYIKFGSFFDWAVASGADYVATGHYARVQTNHKLNKVHLKAGKDKNKDQSYFLWTLTQKQLAKTFFPIGNMEKPEVRKLASKFGLSTAVKKDSQGLCFIGKVDMADFLKHFIKTESGVVLNEKGEIIGNHDGVELYTIGQRHGFRLIKKSANDLRCFIIAKDLKNNTITVSSNNITQKKISDKKHVNEIIIKDTNWINGLTPNKTKNYQARIRYRGSLDNCLVLHHSDKTYKIVFIKKQVSPASGQSVVIYDGEVCLGGGIIE